MRAELIALRVVEWMFFIGLSGCAFAVLMSWISIIKGCLTDQE